MTSPQRPNNADGYFWAGTHVMQEAGTNAEGLCLDFGSRGPTMSQTNGYTEIGNPGFDANVSRMLSYIAGIVDENDPDTADNRDRAVAAAYATWGLTDLSGLGFDNDSSFGNPDWGQLWINGAIGGDVEEWPADPGSNPAAIDAYYQQIKTASTSLLGGLPAFDAGPDVQFGPGQTTTPITPVVTVGGQPVPLIRVRVTSVTNLTGIAVGQEFTTNASGQLGGLVVGLTDLQQPGNVTFEATLPGGTPRFWEAGTIDGLPAQMMLTKGAEQAVAGDINIEPAELPIEIATTARDAADNDNVVIPGGQIIDNVQYSGLIPGASYTLNLTWMLGNGTPSGLTSTVTFTAPADAGNIDVGPVTVPFGLGGQTLVAFEQLVANPGGQIVATHEDITDTSQTITVTAATIGTTARDVADNDNLVIPEGQIIDTISYTGLNPGTTYTAELTWMDQGTGLSTGLTSSVQFTPVTSSGTIDVGPVVVPQALAGHVLVAFERVLAPDLTVVGSHEDINDVAQTVTVLQPEIGTSAADVADGDNVVDVDGQIIDTVAYTNLTVGREYTLNLIWMDADTGQATPLSASVTFTPATPNGTIDVGPVTIPLAQSGKTLVAFEQLSTVINGQLVVVASHEDIDDEEQTVVVNVPPLPEVVTQVSKQIALAGTVITDSFTASNLTNEEQGNATVELQLFDLTADPGATTPLATWSVPGVSNGTTSGVAEYTIPTELAGHTFSYIERIIGLQGRTSEWSQPGEVTETFYVPRIETQASVQQATRGSQVTDTGVVTGLPEGVTATITVTLYGPFKIGATMTCTASTSVTSLSYEVGGNGSWESPIITVPTDAPYGTVFTFKEDLFVGGEKVAEHECGETPETFVVPKITTKIQGGDQLAWRTSTYDVATVTGFTGPGTTKFVGFRFTLDEWNNAQRLVDEDGRAYRVLTCSDDRIIQGSVSTTSFVGTGGVDQVRSKDWLVTGAAGPVVVTREFLYDDTTGVEVANEKCGLEDQSFATRRLTGEEIPITGVETPQAPAGTPADAPMLVSIQAFDTAQPVAAEAQNASVEAFGRNKAEAVEAATAAGSVAKVPAVRTVGVNAPASVDSTHNGEDAGFPIAMLAALVLVAGLGGVIVVRRVRRAH